MQILVLAGGDSGEREVSLRSGAAVTAALRAAGHTVTQLDPANPDDDYLNRLTSFEVVFLALHGKGGEDGTIQKILEDKKVAFVGAGSAASSLSFDKWAYRQKLQAAGLPVAEGQLVDESGFWKSALIQSPFVLKPFDGGSSLDTFIIRDVSDLQRQTFAPAFQKYPEMLLERLIEGQEVTVAVLGSKALPVIEIVPPDGNEFDYENKYNGKTQEFCPPVSVSSPVQQSAQHLAWHIHTLIGIQDMSRTDMIIAENGDIYVLETNTIPGFTPQSLFPKAAMQAGYDMNTLTAMLVEAAVSRN